MNKIVTLKHNTTLYEMSRQEIQHLIDPDDISVDRADSHHVFVANHSYTDADDCEREEIIFVEFYIKFRGAEFKVRATSEYEGDEDDYRNNFIDNIGEWEIVGSTKEKPVINMPKEDACLIQTN